MYKQMKKGVTILFLLMAFAGFAQEKADTTYWSFGGVNTLSFTQVALENWAAGGEESYSLSALSNLFAKYNKGNVSWENTLDMAYGVIKQNDDPMKKSDDKIDFSSKWGYKSNKKWYYTALFSFKTQFAKGYNYGDDNSKEVISDLMAPAYILYSVGMDYKPVDYFSAYISPLTGKTTIVANDSLSALGAFGVEPGNTLFSELGGYVKLNFNKEIFENVTLNTKIDLFSNYLNKPQNIDVNWELLLAMKVNKFLTATISTNLLYDDDTDIIKLGKATSPKVQFKEVLGIGLSYKF